MKKPIADPFNVFPERRPTLHEHCMRHQNCQGPGCRAIGRKWPRRRQRAEKVVRPTETMVRPPLPIPHRVVDLLPALQVIALWEFRQNLLTEEGQPINKTMYPVTRREAVYLPADEGAYEDRIVDAIHADAETYGDGSDA